MKSSLRRRIGAYSFLSFGMKSFRERECCDLMCLIPLGHTSSKTDVYFEETSPLEVLDPQEEIPRLRFFQFFPSGECACKPTSAINFRSTYVLRNLQLEVTGN